MITEKDIIRQQIILKHSREIVKLKRNIEKRNVIIRKLEKERWINYSNDSSHVIYKDRILSFGTLAPEVIFYYKMFCKRIRHEISDNESKSEETMMEQMKDNLSKVAKYLEDSHKINVEYEEDNSEVPMKISGPKPTLH